MKNEKLKPFFEKYWSGILLGFLVILAIFIRLYHFSDWLHFQMDQARDAMVIRDAVENGFSNLPLLGPRAAGTFLRLGPIFYYFQYLSAKITGSLDPSVLAYPDLIFSILSIPLFYFFLRLYFRKENAFLGTTLFAFSFVAVQYSRFAWNPNAVPFWTLLFLFCLLKFSLGKKEKGKYLWSALGAFSLGVASQLHFLAFISLPLIAIAYLIWSRSYRRLDWKNILLILIILIVIYIPVILSEIQTGGSNTFQFFGAIEKKPSANTLPQKIFKTIEVNAQYYLFLLTTNITLISKTTLVMGTVYILASLLFVFFKLRDETDEKGRCFLKIILIWFFVSYVLIFPFAFQVKPRFFFTALFLPFTFFVFWIEWTADFFAHRGKRIIGVIISAIMTFSILALNMEAVLAAFSSAAHDQEPKFWRDRPFVNGEIEKVPLYQLRKAADYLAERGKKEGKKIHIDGNMTYRVPLQYLLEQKNPEPDFEIMSRYDDQPEDLFFSIAEGPIGCYGKTKVLLGSEFKEAHYFGHRFALCELVLPEGFEEERPDRPAKVKKEKKSEPKDSAAEKAEQMERKAKERVYWQDLFE